VRALTFEKSGSSTLELAGFIGKETASSSIGASPVNLIANGGVLSVTNPSNTTTVNTDAINLGTVTVTFGTLAFSDQALVNTAGSAGATSIVMNGGTVKWNTANTQDLSAGNRLTLVDGKVATFNTNGNDVTLSNAFGGGAIAAAVTKEGAGILTLGGVNIYTGDTTGQRRHHSPSMAHPLTMPTSSSSMAARSQADMALKPSTPCSSEESSKPLELGDPPRRLPFTRMTAASPERASSM
jgi:autotransporter-associated beta strand protein